MDKYYLYKNSVVIFSKNVSKDLITDNISEISDKYLELTKSQIEFYNNHLNASYIEIYYEKLNEIDENITLIQDDEILIYNYVNLKCIIWNNRNITCSDAIHYMNIYKETGQFELYSQIHDLYVMEVMKLLDN